MPPKKKTSGKGSSAESPTSTKGNASSSQATLAKLFVPNKKGVRNVDLPAVPDKFPQSFLGRPVTLDDINATKSEWTEEKRRRMAHQFRERLKTLIEIAIKEDRDYLFRYRDDSGQLASFSLRAALRLVVSWTVTEDPLNFLTSRYSGFRRREHGPKTDVADRSDDEKGAMRLALSNTAQSQAWIGNGVALKKSVVPSVQLSGPSADSDALVPVHRADIVIAPILQFYGEQDGVIYDHCYGLIMTGLSSWNAEEGTGQVEKRCLYFDPMTNVRSIDRESENDSDTEDQLFERAGDFRRQIVNERGGPRLKIEQRLKKICDSANAATGAELKPGDFKIVFVETDGIDEYGGVIAVANTICEIIRNPALVTKAKIEPSSIPKPSTKKIKTERNGKTAYQLERKDELFNFEERGYRLGQASFVAWFRVLTFAEAFLSGKDESGADPHVFTSEDMFFEDHHVDDKISEDFVNSRLYTRMYNEAAKEFVKAEFRKEWGKCFFIAFGRLPSLGE